MKSIFFFIFILCASLTFADGMIVPIEPDIQVHPQFPREVPMPEIRVHRVEAAIEGGVARTEIDQVFYNNYARAIEGMYIFPLPKGASVSLFSMYVDGEEVSGDLLEEDEARRIYEEIVRRRLDPAILEYVGTNIFKARVFPFEAHSEKRIKISYDMVLERSGNTYEYVYPLSTEQFSPVPLEEVLVRVEITSEQGLSNVFSPTHEVEITDKDEITLVATYEESDVTPDIDFELFFDVPDDDIGFNILPYREKNDDGFFVALISPQYDLTDDLRIPREVVFVLDISGSMKGEKIKQAKQALSYSLQQLKQDERFGIVAFSSSARLFRDRLLWADETGISEAIRFLEELKAIGGTNIGEAIEGGLSLLRPSEALKIMVFITDGLPTVGVVDSKPLLEGISEKNTSRVRIFSFGVGYDVNTHLLDLISKRNKGLSDYVRPEESVGRKVGGFFDKITLPLVSDAAIKIDGVEVYDLFPTDLPDVFKNTQLILAGRYKNKGGMAISLVGQRHGEAVEYAFGTSVPAVATGRDYVPRMWASQKIAFLLDEIRLSGEDPELIEEVVYLSKKYGIMTPYTSFLVREDVDLALDSAVRRTIDVTRERFGKVSGKAAVDDAVASNVLSQARGGREFYLESLPEEERSQVTERMKYAAGKTFYLRGDTWLDSEYDDTLGKIRIAVFSDAYFEILRQCPSVQHFVSLGKYVTIRYGNLAVLFSEDGIEDPAHPDLREAVAACTD